MKRRSLIAGILAAGTGLAVVFGLAKSSRAGYESAEYVVVESDGSFEIRDYPDLMLASTESDMDAQGRDGGFMRLFRYISGDNRNEQKIAMTTPVFMSDAGKDDVGTMGFVMPKAVAESGVPQPAAEGVDVRKRPGGRYAVIRFAGRLNRAKATEKEAELRRWLDAKGIDSEPGFEAAGYDPPFTPPPLRRNEVLVRLKDAE